MSVTLNSLFKLTTFFTNKSCNGNAIALPLFGKPNILEVTMIQAALETESTLTDRFQTTVPSVVRQALHLNKKDKIKFVIQPNGSVLLSRVEPTESDPVVESFLAFMANDMQKHPEKLQPLTASMRDRVEVLATGIELDLDAPLSDEDE